MSDVAPVRFNPVTIVLIVAAVITMALGSALGIAYLSRPAPITLEISRPKGADVLCDLVIDGKPDSRRATVPVTYKFEAWKLDFAIISESAEDGVVQVRLTSKFGGGNAASDGVRGTVVQQSVSGGISIGPMTAVHVKNMRSARTISSTTDATMSQPEGSPAPSAPLP